MPTTPLFNIPLLETSTFSVYDSNNHYRLLEALHNPRVVAIATEPPATPLEGYWYLVSSPPTGVFVGHAGEVATKLADTWHFLNPLTSPVRFSFNNLLLNPASHILANTFISTQTQGANSSISLSTYFKTVAIATLHSGCTLDLSTLPLFKGDLNLINSGSLAIAVSFFNNPSPSFSLPPNSSRTFLSDGVKVF